MPRSVLSLLLVVAACGPRVAGEERGNVDATSGSSEEDATTAQQTTSGPLPPDPDPSDTTGGGGTSSGAWASDFIVVPDALCGVAPEGTLHHCSWCTTWEQDCPPGEKCVPWATDGSDVWDWVRCSPVDPDPDSPGDRCTVEQGPASGLDSCVLTAMCWNVAPRTLEGECVQFCDGSVNDPVCTIAGTDCMIANDGTLSLCLPTCDPLAADACDDDLSCHPIDDTWFCLPDGAPVHDGPLTPTLCDPGTTGVAPKRLSICDPDAELCCTPICDTAAPTCADPLQCVAIGDGPAGVCVD